jgi:serine/threonine protein phosphatase PrpC
MRAHGIGRTDKGRVREQNEDALLIDNDLGLYIVCDGMGGHARGEVASAISVEVAAKSVAERRAVVDRARRALEPDAALVGVAKSAVEEACREVFRAATTRPGFAGMGTTLTMLLFGREKAVMAHVGDTRLYLIRNGELHQLSTDHTMLAELLKAGAMTHEEAHRSPFAHVVTRAIGAQESVQVDTLLIHVRPSDRFLLCSDGLTEYGDGPEPIAARVTGDFESIPDELVAFANARGGHDNVTVIAVRTEADAPALSATIRLAPGFDVEAEALESLFLLEDLPLAQLERVLSICEVQSCDHGEILFREGDAGDRLLAVVEGRAALVRADHPLGELAPGDCIGETFLLHERPCRATVVAVGATKALAISRKRFRALAARFPRLGAKLLSRLGQRASAALDRAHQRLESTPGQSPDALRREQLL